MRVLIAEDNAIIAMGLATRLRALGHEPLGPAPDGRDAVELARAEQPDLYLFDIDMPRLDGLAAAELLTRQGLRRPVVAITGVDDPTLVDRAIASGVSAYLTKPIDDRELDAAIRLAAHRQRELEALETEAAQARQALDDRKLVEHAKGILIDALALSEPEAFHRIQRTARQRNMRLADVARQIIDQRELLTRPASEQR
ncbi:MAG: ANTAR domain-containing response regulator [Solirubrobacteraceae bacterium]